MESTMEMRASGTLSEEELRGIYNLSSHHFDLLYDHNTETSRLQSQIAKGIAYFENQQRRVLEKQSEHQQHHQESRAVHYGQNSDRCQTSTMAGNRLAEITRHLGHLHLIARDYSKALSAYQQCYTLDKNYWQQVDVLFGLGLIYFHSKQYTCVIETFHKLLCIQPNFKRCGDVYVKLGLSFKALENWDMALKNLNMVLVDPLSSISPQEVRFHIAHCFDQQGQPEKAKELYESLLKIPDLTGQQRASVLQHLGWLYFRSEELGDYSNRMTLALEQLQESLIIEPVNGKTHYYLGQCYWAMGRDEETFVEFQNSIDKVESKADTWCAVGILYQQQRKPIEALQSFACAIQLDQHHKESWVNMAVLYEECGQPKQAFDCYTNAAKCYSLSVAGGRNGNANGNEKIENGEIEDKVKGESGQLPNLDNVWTLPIPVELAKRQKVTESETLLAYLRESLIRMAVVDKDQRPPFAPSQLAPSCTVDTHPLTPNSTGSIQFTQVYQGKVDKPECNFQTSPATILQDTEVTSTTAAPPPPLNLLAKCCVPLSTTASQLEHHCKSRFSTNYVPPVEEYTTPPKLDHPHLNALPENQLLLPTPTVSINSKTDASAELQSFCYHSDVVVLRNFASALRLDLGLFSTKTLMQTAGDQQVEVRTQFHLPPDSNYTAAGDKSWYCGSTRSYTTVAKYAQYQAQSFQQSLMEEQDSPCNAKRRRENSGSNLKLIKFGTNVDLSDDRRWKAQLRELDKLPQFCRVSSSSTNMLNYLNHIVLGMNTVQLYMKVPGSRTPGHQENNNFCSVNLNIGPGECQWYAVAYKYWPAIREMCERNHVDYLKGSWWPPLEDLLSANIPVYRFVQKPGDLVWIGSGAVHWVQAIGWCNNIAWNVGPFTVEQYDLALERYEWNKLHAFKSIVPLIHLSWQLARNVKFTDPVFYDRVRAILTKSMVHGYLSLEYVNGKLGKESRYQPRENGEPAHYCTVCEVEMFNILYVTEQDRKFVVHCLYCALRIDQSLDSFTILNQYTKEELAHVYDQFALSQK